MKFNFKNRNITLNPVETHDEIELGLKPRRFQKQQYSASVKVKTHFTLSVPSKKGSKKIKISEKKGSSLSQNCSIIAKYRNDLDGHFKNLEYIQKEGKALDGGEPELYGSEESQEKYKNFAENKNWRIIISPQQNNIDLTALTKTFIEKLEFETGYKFTWIAANHYDTDNFHTHLLINGKDKNGRDVNFLPREKVSQLFRMYARDICTKMVGYRTQDDIEKDYEKMERKNYLTKLDKTLDPLINNNILSRSYLGSRRHVNLANRLKYLEEIGLCEYQKNIGTYKFKDNWKDELILLGKYNTYYDGYKYADCAPYKYYLHEPKKDGNITGKILKIYTMQKDSNNFAVVLKTKGGMVGYVPLNFYPEGCYTGDTIKIETKEKKMYINNYSRKK